MNEGSPGRLLDLPPGERLAPTQKSVDVATEVLGIEGRGLGTHGEIDGGQDGPFGVEIQSTLRGFDGLLRECGYLVSRFPCRLQNLSVGADMIGESDLGRSPGGDPFAGEGVFLGQEEAGVQGPGEWASVCCHEADLNMGVGEVGDSAM